MIKSVLLPLATVTLVFATLSFTHATNMLEGADQELQSLNLSDGASQGYYGYDSSYCDLNPDACGYGDNIYYGGYGGYGGYYGGYGRGRGSWGGWGRGGSWGHGSVQHGGGGFQHGGHRR